MLDTQQVRPCAGRCAIKAQCSGECRHPAPVAIATNRLTVLDLRPEDYPGGIAMWGALPAVLNTSAAPDEFGVHVHARMKVGGTKSIDETFDLVRVQVSTDTKNGSVFTVNGDDAARYNVATILGIRLVYLRCPACANIHSDEDYGLVHPHTEHVCEVCGSEWASDEPCVSNPVMLLKECCGDVLQDRQINDPVDRNIDQPQRRFPGGVQIWGSNPAIVWTSPKPEEGGLHFHAFVKRSDVPDVDETYGTVTLDGERLDAEQVRYLMAQRALPFLEARVVSLTCPACEAPHFDRSEQAVTPHSEHECSHCGQAFTSPGSQPMVSNPILTKLSTLSINWSNIISANKPANAKHNE